MSQITASKLELAIRCPSAFALPHRDARVHGSDPDAGRARHAEQEAVIAAGDVPEDLERRWPGYTWLAEVKVCYDLATDTGEIFGYGNDRGYEDRGPFVVFGTADVVGRLGDRVVVADRKGFNAQTPADRNPQVAILALAVTRAWELSSAEVAIIPEAGHMDVAVLEALDLDAFASEAREAVIAVGRARQARHNGTPLTFAEGPWCTYCPAFHACGAKQSMALQLRGEAALRLDLANDNDAADAYEFAQKVRQLLKRLDGAIYARAAERPIPLSNGNVLAKVVEEGNDRLDGDAVWKVVAERHGREIADTAVIRSATKKRIKEALEFAGVPSVAKSEREIIQAVREIGGVTNKETTTIKLIPATRPLKAL